MSKIVQTFTDFGNREWKNRLIGGNADNKTPEDFDPDDIAIGTAVEREHTSNPDIATEISIDHLSQDNEYYDKLISSGIADEEDAIKLFNDLKGHSARMKAKMDIEDFFDQNDDFDQYNDEDDDYDNDNEYDDYDEEPDEDDDDEDEDDDFDYEEDELGGDKADIDQEDELIIDDDDNQPKNKNNIMEKSILKNYKSFLRESNEQTLPMDEPAPRRMYSPENKSKVQIAYDESLLQGMEDHLLKKSYDSVKPTENSFIVLDYKDDKYKIVPEPVRGIRVIEDIEEQFYKDL